MRRGNRVTRREVAQRAGVSTATVSYVINGGPKPVASETRRRVLLAIEELGYYPNDVARSLRANHTSTIGLVIPDLLNPIYAALARNLEDLCFNEGYMAFVCDTNRDTEKEQRMAKLLRAKHVDGVIFLPDSGTLESVRLLQQANVPLVVLEHDLPEFHCVAIDDFRGGMIGTEYLIRLGHRRIAFIQQPSHTTSRKRLDGYLEALHRAHIEMDETLIIQCASGYAEGAAATRELLAIDRTVTAVFAHNDIIALGAIHAIRNAGLSVPGDISVMGYDNIASAVYSHPALTTITYPREAMAERVAQRLFSLINVKGDLEPVTEFLPVRLIERESTGFYNKNGYYP